MVCIYYIGCLVVYTCVILIGLYRLVVCCSDCYILCICAQLSLECYLDVVTSKFLSLYIIYYYFKLLCGRIDAYIRCYGLSALRYCRIFILTAEVAVCLMVVCCSKVCYLYIVLR